MASIAQAPAPGDHGGDAARIAVALGLDPATMIDLSASMNPFAPDVRELAVRELMVAASGSLARYPDPRAATAALAQTIAVDPDLLVLTNGGAEAIALVAGEVQAGNIVEPEFSLYRRHLARIDDSAPRWRSNPSNPLGQLAEPDETAGVWDEAFYPLATGEWTRGDDESWRLGSLTKIWNCAGLRLGYVIAPDPGAAARIRSRQPQWAVNGLALSLLPELLTRTDLPGWHARMGVLRSRFAAELTALGYAARPTSANWLLIDHPDLRQRLASHGVVVRDCASFGLSGTHRVAVPHPAQLDGVLDAFARIGAAR